MNLLLTFFLFFFFFSCFYFDQQIKSGSVHSIEESLSMMLNLKIIKMKYKNNASNLNHGISDQGPLHCLVL